MANPNDPPFRVEIKLVDGRVSLRYAPTDHPPVAEWDILAPGSVHVASGYTQAELKALGNGFHMLQPKVQTM